jgi:hypothetical protein
VEKKEQKSHFLINIFCTGGQTLNSVSVYGIEKNTAESKGMTYGIPALDAVWKFSNEAWLFLAKPLDFLHLCMGENIHKINTNLILLTGPDFLL